MPRLPAGRDCWRPVSWVFLLDRSAPWRTVLAMTEYHVASARSVARSKVAASLARVGVVNALVPAVVVGSYPSLYTSSVPAFLLTCGFAGHIAAVVHGLVVLRAAPAQLPREQARALAARVSRWLLPADVILYAGVVSALVRVALAAL